MDPNVLAVEGGVVGLVEVVNRVEETVISDVDNERGSFVVVIAGVGVVGRLVVRCDVAVKVDGAVDADAFVDVDVVVRWAVEAAMVDAVLASVAFVVYLVEDMLASLVVSFGVVRVPTKLAGLDVKAARVVV